MHQIQNSPFHPIINIPGFTCLREPRVLMTPAARYWWMCISKQDRWALAKLHTRTASFNSRSSGHKEVTATASGAGELNFSNHSNTFCTGLRTVHSHMSGPEPDPLPKYLPSTFPGLFTLEEYFPWATHNSLSVWQIHWANEIWARGSGQTRCIYRRWTHLRAWALLDQIFWSCWRGILCSLACAERRWKCFGKINPSNCAWGHQSNVSAHVDEWV